MTTPQDTIARQHSLACSCYEAAWRARKSVTTHRSDLVSWMIEIDGRWVVSWGPRYAPRIDLEV